MTTVGGGVILDVQPRRIKLNSPQEIERLDRLHSTPVNRIYQMIEDAGCSLIKEAELVSASGLSAKAVHAAIQELQQMGVTVRIQGGFASRKVLDELEEKAAVILKKHHEAQSLMEGMSLSEFRGKLFTVSAKTNDVVLNYLKDKGKLRIVGSSVSLPSFQADYSPEQASLQADLEAHYLKCGFEPPLNTEVAESFGKDPKLTRQVMARMTRDGILVALNPNVTCHASACKQALETFRTTLTARRSQS